MSVHWQTQAMARLFVIERRAGALVDLLEGDYSIDLRRQQIATDVLNEARLAIEDVRTMPDGPGDVEKLATDNEKLRERIKELEGKAEPSGAVITLKDMAEHVEGMRADLKRATAGELRLDEVAGCLELLHEDLAKELAHLEPSPQQ